MIKYILKDISIINKILITLFILFIYRLSNFIPIPGINFNNLNSILLYSNSINKNISNIITAFIGNNLSHVSIISLGIMPYITSSIIIQFIVLINPSLYKTYKQGYYGKTKLDNIIRILTIIICLIQSIIYIKILTTNILPINCKESKYFYVFNMNSSINLIFFWLLSITSIVVGSLFTIWLSDILSNKGICNGVSLIIMSNVVSRLPDIFISNFLNYINIYGKLGILIVIFEFILWFIAIMFCIYILKLTYKINIQYINMVNIYKTIKYDIYDYKILYNGIYKSMYIKVAIAGIMPIIFSQSFLLLLNIFFLFINKYFKVNFIIYILQNIYSLYYNIFLMLLVFLFTHFFTKVSLPVSQIVNSLKYSEGYIPGVVPGKNTEMYINNILNIITPLGGILISIISILPSLVHYFGIDKDLSLFFGGTSLSIVISVILDMISNIIIILINNSYIVI